MTPPDSQSQLRGVPLTPEALHPVFMPKPRREQRRDVSPLIYQTIVDLQQAGRQASRQVLMEELDLKYTQIDDVVKRLVDDGKLRRVANGVFEPIIEYPEMSAISHTWLPDGMIKIEIGDFMVTLAPPQQRALARMLMGAMYEGGGSEQMREMADTVAQLGRHVHGQRDQQGQISEMLQNVAHTNAQLLAWLTSEGARRA